MGYFLLMEHNQKPEWFELVENDQPTTRSRKKKSAPLRSLTFVLAGALVIPMGAGFALLKHEDHSVIAAESLNSVQDSPAATSSTQALPESTIAMPTASREDDDEGDADYRPPVFSNSVSSAPTSGAQVTTQVVQNSPAATSSTSKAPIVITSPESSAASNQIILPPTKKSGDDDDDDDDDDHENKKSNGKKSKDSDDDEEDDD
jgi:hypothetical protein